MVVRRRIIAGIEDIQAVRLQCVKCHLETVISPDIFRELPQACECGQSWVMPDVLVDLKAPKATFNSLLRSIPAARRVYQEFPEKIGFKVLLEFDEPY